MIIGILFQLAMRFLATIITVMFAIVYMIIVVTLLLVLLVGMRWYYIKTARDVKRLEALGQLRCSLMSCVTVLTVICCLFLHSS